MKSSGALPQRQRGRPQTPLSLGSNPRGATKRCRHVWKFVSHNDFRDGEYYVCQKCRKTKGADGKIWRGW